MVKVEKISESDVGEVMEQRPAVKLNAGEKISGITIDGVVAAESDFGKFMVMNCTDSEGEEFALYAGISNVWGRNCIATFAVQTNLSDDEVAYTLQSKFVGRKLWIGKGLPIKGKGPKPYMKLEWGFDDE